MIFGRYLTTLSGETATAVCGQLRKIHCMRLQNPAVYSQMSHYHVGTPCMSGKEWREKRGMPANPNAYGPLTDRPDYHFVKDGRKAPPGSGKIRRVKEQREWMDKIISLTAQVDFAVERYERKVKEKEDAKAKIISYKLKQKGNVPSEY